MRVEGMRQERHTRRRGGIEMNLEELDFHNASDGRTPLLVIHDSMVPYTLSEEVTFTSPSTGSKYCDRSVRVSVCPLTYLGNHMTERH